MSATRRNQFVASMVIACFLSATTVAEIYRVDSTATGSATGLSWPNAFTSIEAAFAQWQLGDEIWVAAGTYVPSVKTISTDDRSKTFFIGEDLDGIKIYGGFLGLAHPSGGETSLGQRDPENNITILSGDIDSDDGPDPFEDNEENAYHVVTFEDVDNDTLLDGFTITGANATGLGFPGGLGGGVRCNEASPTIGRCLFRWNQATQGGGLGAWGNVAPIGVVNCQFLGNSATAGAGVLLTFAGHAVIVNSTFIGNTAAEGGSAIDIREHSFPTTLINCSIAGNVTSSGGGGVMADADTTGEYLTITGCVIWANEPAQIALADSSSLVRVSFSDVEGGLPTHVEDGGDNINANPEFVRDPDPGADDEWGSNDDDYGDLRLTFGSPCINMASNDDLPADFGDLNTNSDFTERLPRDLDIFRKRVLDNVADMGAFEFGCNADLDASCEIDEDDLDLLLGEWTGSETYESFPPYQQADLNEDGRINGIDMGILLANWGDCPDCGEEESLGGGSSESASSETSLLAQFWQWWLESDWDAFFEWAAGQE